MFLNSFNFFGLISAFRHKIIITIIKITNNPQIFPLTIVDNFDKIRQLLPPVFIKNMDINKLWLSIIAEIEIQVSKPFFVTLFKNSSLISLENNVATISCANNMSQKMIEMRYYGLIKSLLDKKTDCNNSLVFVIKKIIKEASVGPLFSQTSQEATQRTTPKTGLNPFYTFENFAVSSSNQVAYAAAQAVVKNPGTAYNPFFLYGGVGVGKTHLMQAITHSILEKKSRFKFLCCTSEEFTNEIIEAIKQKNTSFFKNRYRGVDLLMIDDIQFIAGKEKVQEELFHTYNSLQKEGAQVLLTSDRPPKEIPKLEERLRSRFDSGLIIDVSPPDFELRTAILLIKAGSLKINLPMETAQLIAGKIEDSRSLEGFLRRLMAEAESNKALVSTELAASLLKINVQEKKDDSFSIKIKPDQLIETVAGFYNLKSSVLKGPKRDRFLVVPRQIAMYLLRVDCGLPFMSIGDSLGGRDHTTIMHGVEKISTLLSTNGSLKEDLLRIKKQLQI